MTMEEAFGCIKEDTKFETIRVEEPDLFAYHPLPLLQFIMPSFGKKTLIRENKGLGLDKGPRQDFSITNFYHMSDPTNDREKLQKLKKRNCYVSVPKILSTLKQRREQAQMNQMVFFDKYNDLLVFDCPQMDILTQVLFAILDLNRSLNHQEDQQFLCFFEPLLNKVASVTKFQ